MKPINKMPRKETGVYDAAVAHPYSDNICRTTSCFNYLPENAPPDVRACTFCRIIKSAGGRFVYNYSRIQDIARGIRSFSHEKERLRDPYEVRREKWLSKKQGKPIIAHDIRPLTDEDARLEAACVEAQDIIQAIINGNASIMEHMEKVKQMYEVEDVYHDKHGKLKEEYVDVWYQNPGFDDYGAGLELVRSVEGRVLLITPFRDYVVEAVNSAISAFPVNEYGLIYDDSPLIKSAAKV